MPNMLGRKVSSSLRSLFLKRQNAQSLENLEPRTLLAADIPVGGALLDWGGNSLVVKPGSYVLTFDDYMGNQQAELLAREAATRLGISAERFRPIANGKYATLHTTDPLTREQAQWLAEVMPSLKAFEPNALYQPNRLPNDPQFSQQWWLSNTGQNIQGQLGTIGADIHAVEAWDTTIGSRDVIVAVIDTGIDLTHPDLIPNLWTNPGEVAGNGLDDDGNGFVDDVHGFDFGEGDGSPQDIAGHGTAVAGVIGAAGNNNLGVTGVNWNVSIMGLKVADDNGNLSLDAIVAAHEYATMMINRGVNIVASNNSYGGYQPAFYAEAPDGFAAERDAIEAFIDTGRATFVASAGNDAFDNDDPDVSHFPSSYNIPGLLSVAATDNNDTLANFSSFGQQTVNLAAPGVNVFTTAVGGGYQFADGTSFSAPAVAGAVALMQAAYRATHGGQNASPVAIREALINGSDLLPSLEGRLQSGGRINVARSMELLNIDGPVVRGVTPGPVTGQLSSNTGQPVNSITVTFSRDIDEATLTTSGAALIGDGVDNVFGTGDDRVIPISAVTRSATNPRVVTYTLNLSGFAQSRLPIDNYRFTLTGTGATAIKDTSGNFLNGNSSDGENNVYNFRVTAATGDNEPNDTRLTATPVAFDSAGQANFNGVTLGNGLQVNLDVDLYRIDMPRAGLITAEILAKRLPAPSGLDSYLRLFDANGNQIAANDQTFGQDAFIDFFVFTGGTYYIGVSGFGNDDYNPDLAGSGSSQSTGVYNLRLNVVLQNDETKTFASTDAGLPRRVPPQVGQTQGTTSSFIDIADTRQILDVNVRFSIAHEFNEDLEIRLIGPDNTTIVLVNNRGGNGQNFTNTILNDEATLSIAQGTAPFTGSFRPEQSLGAFDGKVAAGRWTLVVDDESNLNSGFLNSWSLEITFKNNIFGPFESNDTLATAKVLNEITGTGAATRTAFIGDGGFGSLDRDIFRFTADAGSTINAVLTSGGSLNGAIRIFDAAGNQVLFSSPTNSNGATIENFVFANSGIYYIAISEASNLQYDPNVGASGTAAATTGTYTLTVNLAAGVSDPGNVLSGTPVDAGINTGATFGQANINHQIVGLQFNGIEFLPTASNADSFLGLVASGNNFSNSTNNGDQLSFALSTASDQFNNRLSARASFRGLNINRIFSYGANDSFIAVDVYFTNTTGSILQDVGWMEGFNPDPGISLAESNSTTANDVDASGKVASATYTNNQFEDGLTVALAAPASDARARATVIDGTTVVRDPSILLAQAINDPNGTVSDSQLVLAYDLGNINPGQTTTIRYFIFFGNTPAAVDAQVDAVNNGTGTGHLTANPATPANEVLNTGTGPAASVPSLPYRQYYPEGFFGDNIYTFVPVANMSDETATVYIIAHYEFGNRDQLVGTLTLNPNARSGITITTPELFRNGGVLAGRPGTPYALEVRSDRPVAATFSHYDLGILAGHQAAIGEAFTTVTDTQWSFGTVTKNLGGNVDFILFYNPGDQLTKVTGQFFPQSGGAPFEATFNLAGKRRGGFAVDRVRIATAYTFTQSYTLKTDYQVVASNSTAGFTTINGVQIAEGTVLPAGTVINSGSTLAPTNFVPNDVFGVRINSDRPVVASLSHYNFSELNAAGSIGNAGAGAVSGVIPEGQFGTNAQSETISVLNTSNTATTVVFTFLFQNGSSIRHTVPVAKTSTATFDTADIPNFITNQPYAVFYSTAETNSVPVTVSMLTRAFGDAESSTVATQAFTMWGFGEGFRPADNSGHPGIVETLRLYNPSENDITVEITIGYTRDRGAETFRRVLPARRVTEFNMDQFVTGQFRAIDAFYGTRVKAPVPIVAYMSHYDRAFQGLVPDPVAGAAFGTLGTPIGRVNPVA
ncbi:MAG TPA: sensory rhodopsin transducer [Phycisphaerales bacterium]|nr:sensory rhodopsin transducer [Phycisphaerales bacterium]